MNNPTLAGITKLEAKRIWKNISLSMVVGLHILYAKIAETPEEEYDRLVEAMKSTMSKHEVYIIRLTAARSFRYHNDIREVHRPVETFLASEFWNWKRRQ